MDCLKLGMSSQLFDAGARPKTVWGLGSCRQSLCLVAGWRNRCTWIEPSSRVSVRRGADSPVELTINLASGPRRSAEYSRRLNAASVRVRWLLEVLQTVRCCVPSSVESLFFSRTFRQQLTSWRNWENVIWFGSFGWTLNVHFDFDTILDSTRSTFNKK